MLPIIIISVVAIVIAIGAYQLVIQKYYWGPGGDGAARGHKADKKRGGSV
ncbi:MAG TPA: hypothetical protein VF735_18640 [Pyrinomonadaceae bacterium]|jgi:hypothetical protein